MDSVPPTTSLIAGLSCAGILLYYFGTLFLAYLYRKEDVIQRRFFPMMTLIAILNTIYTIAALLFSPFMSPILQYVPCYVQMTFVGIPSVHIVYCYVVKNAYLAVANFISNQDRKPNVYENTLLNVVRFTQSVFRPVTARKKLSVSSSMPMLNENMDIRKIGFAEFWRLNVFQLIIEAIVTIIAYFALSTQNNAACGMGIYIPHYVMVLLLSVVYLFAWIVIRGQHDDLWMEKELGSVIAIYVIIEVFNVLLFYSDLPVFLTLRTGGYTPLFFNGIVCLSTHTVSITIPTLMAVFHIRTKKSLNLTEEDFHAALKDPATYQELRQQAVSELCVENFLFLEEFSKICAIHGSPLCIIQNKSVMLNSSATVSRSIHAIYRLFIEKNSYYELNLPDATVETFQKTNGDDNNLEVLKPIQEQVLRMIYENTYCRYVKRKKTKS